MAVKVEQSDENKNNGLGQDVISETEVLKRQIEDMRKALEDIKSSSVQASETSTNDKLVEALLKKINNVGEVKTTIGSFQGYTAMEDITKEDMLEQHDQVTFMCPKSMHVVIDTYINNKPVPAPYRPIIFKLDSAKRIKNGKETDIFYTSKYTCKSKKELEFLRKNHLYGVAFFENIKDFKEADTRILDKMITVFNSLKRIDAVEIIRRCRENNIPTTNDIHGMRSQLAMVEAKRLYQEEAKNMSEHVRKAIIEEDLLKK